MEVFSNNIVEVTYDQRMRLGSVIWKGKPRTIMDYKEPFYLLLEFAADHKVEKFMSDTTKQGVLNQEFRKVFETDIMPKAVASGMKAASSVSDTSPLKRYYNNMLLKAMNKFNAPFKVFSDRQSAIEWMNLQVN